MKRSTIPVRLLSIVLLPAVVAGCSDPPGHHPRFPLVPVHGVVRLKGKPVEGARVTFHNTEKGVSAYGVTDAEGRFTLTTFLPGDGAVPGREQITVTKAEESGHATAKTAPPVFRTGRAPRPRWLIPQRYSSPLTSGLMRDVSETGDNEIVLDLEGS
ncbi:MAG TPA: carboxypeptidase-like regulatory domain-containing protein [Gemmataceae bacterium]|nr:carboxypeptidase-like regulatory domain-containing protein [Gemmataceae bacterium]